MRLNSRCPETLLLSCPGHYRTLPVTPFVTPSMTPKYVDRNHKTGLPSWRRRTIFARNIPPAIFEDEWSLPIAPAQR